MIKKSWMTYVALGFAAVAWPALADESKSVVFAGFGGAQQDDLVKAVLGPAAEKTGLTLTQQTLDGIAAVRVQVQSGSPGWDVVQLGSDECAAGTKEGLFEPLDYKQISSEGYSKAQFGIDWIGINTYSWVLAWRTDVYKDNPPKNWKDFWDVTKFPGRRAFHNKPNQMLEIALMADGVDREKLYPIDVKRAFASLEKIQPSISVWFQGGSQAQQLLKDNEVDMEPIFVSRAKALIKDGAPVDFTFEDGMIDVACLAIPKGAAHVEAAQKFIAAAVSPEIQARLPEFMPYAGSPNSLAYALTKAPPEVVAKSNSSPDNLKKQAVMDAVWWSENNDSVMEEYTLLTTK